MHSKALAWTALDRACQLVEALGLPGDLYRWRAEADELRLQVLAEGVRNGHFVRSYGDHTVDASLLMLPLVGFVDGRDPLMRATIDTVRDQLSPPDAAHPGLLRRYRTDTDPRAGDGLPGGEGAFTLCGFWLVEALTLAGRHDEAGELFETLCDHGGRWPA